MPTLPSPLTMPAGMPLTHISVVTPVAIAGSSYTLQASDRVLEFVNATLCQVTVPAGTPPISFICSGAGGVLFVPSGTNVVGTIGNLTAPAGTRGCITPTSTAGSYILMNGEGLQVQASRTGDIGLAASDVDSVVRVSGTNIVSMSNLGQQFAGIKVERVAGSGSTSISENGVSLVPRSTGALMPIANDGAYFRIEPSGTAGKYYVTRVGN